MAYTTIDDPSAHFQIATHTTTGSATITNDGDSDLQPDLIWSKSRSATRNHAWFDSTRGVTKYIISNLNNAEATTSAGFDLTSFNTDGFSTGNNQFNTICGGDDYVAWQWKANGGSRTTNAEDGNDPGGGYQANTTAGFSIVDYTGTGATGTMAHGLGAVPHVMIHKNRADARDWRFYHHTYGAEKYLDMDTTAALGDASTPWNDTDPTSSVFTVGSDGGSNDDGDAIIAYIWTEIQGFSKFGSYIGNGNADGTFVYTGFSPSFIMQKRTDSTDDWYLWDRTRALDSGGQGYLNRNDKYLLANENGVQSTGAGFDFLSNGFKPKDTTAGYINADTATYVYMAFAHQPFVTSGGVPCTATA